MLLALLVSLAPALPSQTAETAPERPRNVAIVVYDGVELLDFAGPGEVFSAARAGGRHGFRVYTVAASTEPVVSQGFVTVTPAHTFEDCPAPDIVVVPGGGVPLRDMALRAFVQESAQRCELVMSVCNGAGVLAAAGLLDGLEVTTHYGSYELVQTMAPKSRVLRNRRFVDNGKILTSAGVSAGIDAALHVVARLHGAEAARSTARYMVYDWRPDEIAELHAQPGERIEPEGPLELLALLEGKSAQEVLPAYRELAESSERFSELEVNRLGYTLLNSERGAEALGLFELAQAAYPRSANACDSLAEAHEVLGHAEEALRWSKHCLERLGGDEGLDEERAARLRKAAADRIARLEANVGRTVFACPPCGMPCDVERFDSGGRCRNSACGLALVEVQPAAAR